MSLLATMSPRRKITFGIVLVYVVGLAVFGIVFGVHEHQNTQFNIVAPFHLVTWVHLVGPLNINKGVLYLLITTVITIGILLWVARHMQMRPNRVQTAVEWLYDLSKRLTNDSMDEQMARKWFPLVFTLFVFVLVTNLLGYIPLPINTAEKFNVAGAHIPSFQIYAADTNVALPLVLALGVFIAYNVEGCPPPRVLGVPEELGSVRRGRRHAALPVPTGDHVPLPAAALADDPAMGEPTCRAPSYRFHGG